MRKKTKKATFNLPVDVLTAVDEIMKSGLVPSKNVLVEQTFIKELNELKKQLRKEQWKKAANDPLLMKDIKDIETSFSTADAETIGRTD